MTNDKDRELIERLILVSGIKDGLVVNSSEALEKFIARYLEERRKEAVAWHTDDHLTDKSATTYDREVSERWKAKGWLVTPLFLAPQPAIPEGLALVEAEPDDKLVKKAFETTRYNEGVGSGKDLIRAYIAAAGVAP